MDKWVEEFTTALDAYDNTLERDEERNLVNDMLEAFDAYMENCEIILANNRAGRLQESVEIMDGACNDLRLQIESDYQRLKEIKIEDGENDMVNN